jgi:hypothetical protein
MGRYAHMCIAAITSQSPRTITPPEAAIRAYLDYACMRISSAADGGRFLL